MLPTTLRTDTVLREIAKNGLHVLHCQFRRYRVATVNTSRRTRWSWPLLGSKCVIASLCILPQCHYATCWSDSPRRFFLFARHLKLTHSLNVWQNWDKNQLRRTRCHSNGVGNQLSTRLFTRQVLKTDVRLIPYWYSG